MQWEMIAQSQCGTHQFSPTSVSEEVIKLCCFAAQKLMIVGRNNCWREEASYRDCSSIRQAIERFLDNLVQDRLVRYCDVIAEGRVKPLAHSSGASAKNLESDCQNLREAEFHHSDVPSLMAHNERAFEVNLLCGGFRSGLKLRGVFVPDQEPDRGWERFACSEVSKIFHRWQRFSRTSLGLKNELMYSIDLKKKTSEDVRQMADGNPTIEGWEPIISINKKILELSS